MRVVTNAQSKPAHPSRQISVILTQPEQRQDRAAQADDSAAGDVRLNGRKLPNQGPLAELVRELDQMVGLENVKDLVYEIYALLQVSRYRKEAGLSADTQVYHMIFKGNPGTGKTTVARILGKMFHQMGVLPKGHLLEVERADLVGEYIGHTAIKTREWVKKALGGVLFIDEAYSLARGGEKDFGKEAIDALVKAMEDYRDKFVLILAGYPEEMELFLHTNPGLPSRFPIMVDFADYTVDELLRIAEQMARVREYHLLPQTLMKLKQHLLQEKSNAGVAFSNARFVRNQIEKAIRHQAVRLLNDCPHTPGRQELMEIRPEDLRL